MRLSPPSSILTRLEYVAAVRRMLWAHGFGLTCLERTDEDDYSSETDSVPDEDDRAEGQSRDDDDGDSWRRAKAIVVAHSFGTEAAAWLLRDAVRAATSSPTTLRFSAKLTRITHRAWLPPRHRPTSSPARSCSTR